MKNLVLLSATLWCFSFIIGIFYSENLLDASYIINKNSKFLEFEKSFIIPSEDFENPFSFIIPNLKSDLLLIFGAFTLGLVTIVNLIFNGVLIGLAIGGSFWNTTDLDQSLLLIIPHGIFEFSAIWLAGAAGLKGPQVFIRYLIGGKFVTKQDVKEFLILSLTSIILIIIAGIIEATVTYEIAKTLIE